MDSNNTSKAKATLGVFSILLTLILLPYIVSFLDVALIFFKNLFSDDRAVSTKTISSIISEDYKQPMNQAYMSMFTKLLFILIFGIWYFKAFYKNKEKLPAREFFKNKFRLFIPVIIVVIGYGSQLFVDGVLSICQNAFPSAFLQYNEMLTQYTGVSAAWPYLLGVSLLAPIAEELIFRGLFMGYASTYMKTGIAIVLQALLFALYHGNLIQGIYAFVFGIVLGIIASKYNSLLPSILLHIAINCSINLVPYSFFSSTTNCIITSVVAFVVSAALFALLYAPIFNHSKEDSQ